MCSFVKLLTSASKCQGSDLLDGFTLVQLALCSPIGVTLGTPPHPTPSPVAQVVRYSLSGWVDSAPDNHQVVHVVLQPPAHASLMLSQAQAQCPLPPKSRFWCAPAPLQTLRGQLLRTLSGPLSCTPSPRME